MRNQSNYTSSISTHTPTKGATLMDSPIWTHLKNFNPHSHEGSDVVCDTFCLFLQDFNPHSHEGSDFLTSALPLVLAISTHTPTKGATLASHGCNIYDSRFQPTLPRRERHKCLCESSYIIRFQPTLPRRERQKDTKKLTLWQLFQPTLPRRERQQY